MHIRYRKGSLQKGSKAIFGFNSYFLGNAYAASPTLKYKYFDPKYTDSTEASEYVHFRSDTECKIVSDLEDNPNPLY